MKEIGLRCPLCKSPLAFGEQVMEWDVEYGEDVEVDDEWLGMINIFCNKCDFATVSVDIHGVGINLSKKTQRKIAKDIEKIEKEKN